MKYLKPAVACLILATSVLGADAKRAIKEVITVQQPDGTPLNIRLHGDEIMHFVTTEDGTLLTQDANGLYTYAEVDDNGIVVSTGVSATSPARQIKVVNLKDVDLNAIAEKRNLAERRSQTFANYDNNASSSRFRAPQTGYGLTSTNYPLTGSPKGLVILVEYSDVPFTHSNPGQYFNDLINKKGFNEYGATGSALDYFTEQSVGKFTPSFDVYGPVKLPNKREYYGGNVGGDDKNPHLMVTDAIKILDQEGVDFSQYDTNRDGVIDNVYVFYAGQGEADSGIANTVWPHSWDVRYGGVTLRVDGVLVGHYACSNEWDSMYKRPDGIGTFVHEFSHVMGLPDLYHTTNAYATYTPDKYSVLDYGPYNNQGRTPPNYGAFELNATGWVEPIMLNEPMTVSLQNITSGQFGLIPTSKDTEFFLLENRQQDGWDKYIPGHGMLIWHIDYNKSVFTNNTVNNSQSHQYVDIEEANGRANSSSEANMAGYPFPGTSGNTSFTSTTTPALKDWSNRAINYPITDITEKNGIITFKVLGGYEPLDVPQPVAVDANENEYYFIASWNAIDRATDYFITVSTVSDVQESKIETGFDGSTLPSGWEASVKGWYSTLGNYGNSAPSFKFSTDGSTLTTPQLEHDITKVEFWAQGQSTSNSGTKLQIYGLINGSWVLVEEYTPKHLEPEDVTIVVPAGVRQIMFKFIKDKGNIALDDVAITYGGSGEVLPDYNSLSTGGATTIKVDKLKPGVTDYSFTVTASDGKQLSEKSEPVFVKVLAMSGVESVGVDADRNDAPVEYFNLQGVRVSTPVRGSVIIRRQGDRIEKVIIR